MKTGLLDKGVGRSICLCAWVLAAAGVVPGQTSFEGVVERARELAAGPHHDRHGQIPDLLKQLDYDSYRKISPRAQEAMWRDSGLPFEVGFYHLGYLYHLPVRVEVLEDGAAHHVPFDPQYFNYYLEGGAGKYAAGVEDFAGWYAMYPFGGGPYREAVSFLGASYFRGIGTNHIYGTSARGLAIDQASHKTETFPAFTHFWIGKPREGDRMLEAWALLQSAPVVGAYRFRIAPGDATTIHVEARLFVREPVEKVGYAPLTSMFFHAPGSRRPQGYERDPRPAVHDSEGLLLQHANGEWLWRPLSNPAAPRTSSFSGDGVVAYGLVQRHTDEAHYNDSEALYHRRPTVWVKLSEGFDRGRVELLELPAPDEGVDNIGAWWVPEAPLQKGEEKHLVYTVSFITGDPSEHSGTRAFGYYARPVEAGTELAITFREGFLNGAESSEELQAIVTMNGGDRIPAEVRETSGGRMVVATLPHGAAGDIRATLSSNNNRFSETWSGYHAGE